QTYNSRGSNGSNGVSQSEGTQVRGVEQAIREGESHRGGESEDSNSYQSSQENGLFVVQVEPNEIINGFHSAEF
ncbi:MAG: hypothetical protein VB048_04230, partial [Bacteroidaceae bacterium]|nr:hypothetical protein [Bacteroidaceae bacterium]